MQTKDVLVIALLWWLSAYGTDVVLKFDTPPVPVEDMPPRVR